jgi:pyruvate formate lyase activating enzyme
MKRRDFLKALCVTCGAVGSGAAAGCVLSREALAGTGGALGEFHKEAMFYEKLNDGRVRCGLCPRGCVVGDGERGYCRVRENLDGVYYTVVYGRVCTYHVDPIEKKPLFHVTPGTTAFSLATVGCNLECKFCQNWEISQERPENVDAVKITPARAVAAAREAGSPAVAFTYTEPTVYFEYMLETAREARKAGLKSVMISSGFIAHDPLAILAATMSAIKIDLKAFTEDYYARICGGRLAPVLDSVVTVKKSGTWLELVYLVIPTLNDDDKDIDAMCKWLVENLGSEVPIHFTRFYPTYKLINLPPTPVSAVERARQVALARGIKFAYVGNVPAGHPGESTYCPGCGGVVIKRAAYTVLANNLRAGKCSKCGTAVPGIWS